MYFNDDEIRRINDAASGRLLDVVEKFHTLTKKGSAHVCDCPKCGASKKFNINPNKEIFKCFACNEMAGKGAISYLMTVEGYSYTDALEFLAKEFNVILDDRPQKKAPKPAPVKMKKGSKEAKGVDTESYCARMLAESGLTFEDVTANVYKSDEKSSIFQARTFKPGTIDERGQLTTKGDDVIIEYYDLDGLPVRYTPRVTNRRITPESKEFYRIRWQFPESHLDSNGKSGKYKSPYGSGTPIYIPEKIRSMFKSGKTINRLYIQEGEKKAEKACKHGIPSVAISGIQNLGNKTTSALPEDLVRIISVCGVKEVALIFDSDWDDISTNIKIYDRVEKRPCNFFYAARNYKEYMRTLENRGIYVEIFVGHIRKNEAGDKGLDDLLANSLRGCEEELAKDFDFARNDKKGAGQYVEMFKVTTMTDKQIAELWCLQSHEAFAERHKDILKHLPEFTYGKHRWKFDEKGELVSAQPLSSDEMFWEIVKRNQGKDNEYEICEYRYVNAKNFLQNRGFGRLERIDGSFTYIHLTPPVVKEIQAHDARDFLVQFAAGYCSKVVNEMILKGISQYVGPEKLSVLDYIRPNFIRPRYDQQYFYFEKNCWLVSKNEVKEMGYESISHHIWAEQKRNTPAKYLGKALITFSCTDDEVYRYEISEDGEKCHYLQFLINTSNFTWRKPENEVTDTERNENCIHLLSKLCAIGYMLMEAKDSDVARAVIGMDGKQSEVGESNGRSGKSLIGELMRNVIPIAYIPGKSTEIFKDQFVWNDVQENTKLVFIDDVLQNFNFEFLFPNITGDWSVNYKGGRRITLPFEKSPKIYISTNHAVKGVGASFADRQWLLAFSDFYNDQHKPKDDFGLRFFSQWDFDQWNLCWNLLANCIQLYLTFGVIQAPGERLEQRKLRQEMGEALISWADEYFSDSTKIGTAIPRKELYDAFCNYDPQQRKYISSTAFKTKFKMYCTWKGYVLNPHKYDSVTGLPFKVDKDGKPVVDDKSGGVEYFTIGVNKDLVQPSSAASEHLIDF